MHRHPRRDADEDDASNQAGMAGRRLERDQRAHRVADERGALGARRRRSARAVQSPSAAISVKAGPAETPWPGRSTASARAAVMGEPPALQRPDAMVHARAVEKDDQRLRFGSCARPPVAAKTLR